MNWKQDFKKDRIEWKLERHDNCTKIKAEYDGIDVFRSLKFKDNSIESYAQKLDFRLIGNFVDEEKNACIQIFEKTYKF